jgi:hypothetical protein
MRVQHLIHCESINRDLVCNIYIPLLYADSLHVQPSSDQSYTILVPILLQVTHPQYLTLHHAPLDQRLPDFAPRLVAALFIPLKAKHATPILPDIDTDIHCCHQHDQAARRAQKTQGSQGGGKAEEGDG